MQRLLEATEEYGSVLPLSGKLEAETTKRRIMAFLEQYEETVVDEVLFYYSGHGALVPSGLAFAMSDYSEQRVVRGSFENEELDGYLRSMNPKVAVKILDCCYSGTRYIKGPNDAARALDAAAKKFQDCYFFSSSRQDQESWTGSGASSLSVFTGYFLDAVAQQADGVVRYKQIADSITDHFLQEQQEPQFVLQGNMRHEFCTINASIRRAAEVQRPATLPEMDMDVGEPSPEIPSRDAIAIVQMREEQCIPKEEAIATLAELRARLEGLSGEPMLADFYEEKLWFPDSADFDDDVAGEEEIGKWLKHGGREFFGWATETNPSRRPMSAASAAIMAYGYREGPEITGFVSSAGLGYDRVFLRHIPKFSGLARWEMAAVFLWSPWRAAVFSYGVQLERLGWDRYDQPEKAPWVRALFSRKELVDLPDHVVSRVEQYRSTVASYLERYTGAAYNPAPPPDGWRRR